MLRVNYMRPEQMPAASPGLSSKRVIRTARRRRFPSAGPDGGLVSRGDFRGHPVAGLPDCIGTATHYYRCRGRDAEQVARAMEHLIHEVAVLEMRTEQFRIHLRSVPASSMEARNVRCVLSAMRIKIGTLKRFARTAGVMGRGKATLH